MYRWIMDETDDKERGFHGHIPPNADLILWVYMPLMTWPEENDADLIPTAMCT